VGKLQENSKEKMTWKINQVRNVKIKNPILIEGLPGVGNVGKIATDYMIDSLKAKKLYEITSYNLPHYVFVNEENLIELPTIEIFYKNYKNHTLLLLAGDIQPIDEGSCHRFCEQILDLIEDHKGKKEIITLGGIALKKNPKNPKVYAAANNLKIRKKYSKTLMDNNMYGLVGPIVGVSGLLVGLAGKRKIPAVSLLAETHGHPAHLGINSAKAILKLLNSKLKLNMKLKNLSEDILEIEHNEKAKLNKIRKIKKSPSKNKDLTYIG